MIHIRFEGRSRDVREQELNVQAGFNEAQIKEAVARHLNVAPEKLDFYVVDRTANGDFIVRPEAIYG